jgi:urease accessory protein
MTSSLPFLAYVQLLDSALPIGGFSHSFGLESYVQANVVVTTADLERYIFGQLHSSLAPMEGLVIKGVYEAIDRQDYSGMAKLDHIMHVQRLPRESREGQAKMGKRLMKLAKSLDANLKLDQFEELLVAHDAIGTLPVVHGWICRHLGVSMDDAVKGYLYSSVQTMVNSALRLMSMGQTEGQLIVRRALPLIEQEWQAVRHLAVQQAHTFTFTHDIRAMQHETLYSRLFMS